jgi:hypothetical protein
MMETNAITAHSGDGSQIKASARWIEYEPGCQIALPVHTTMELVDNLVVVAVPGAAYYAHSMLAWRGSWIPLINLGSLLHAHVNANADSQPRYALVVAYQRAPSEPLEHGAIGLAALPLTVMVEDAAQCALPADGDLWPLIALSCFRHNGHDVPILDTACLFANYQGRLTDD